MVYFLPKRVDSLSLSLFTQYITITKNLLVNIIMQVKIVSWKFVVNHQLGTWHICGILLYFRVLTSFLAIFLETLIYLCYVEILNWIQVQCLILVIAFGSLLELQQQPIIFLKFLFGKRTMQYTYLWHNMSIRNLS